MSNLPRFSYSRLSTFIQCPMKYKLKYIEGNYEQADAIHLDMGNILHKSLEIKYRKMIEGEAIDYNILKGIIENGIAEETEKDKGNFLLGVKQIKEKFGNEIFLEVNEKSGLSYNDKMSIFYEYLENDNLEDDWKPYAVEQSFEFEFDNRVIFTGFIDRIDVNSNGEYRVVDYKSSNKVFSDKDLVTPLQMVIYALACEELLGKVPIQFQYDMVLLGEKQQACTKGYYDRGAKKIKKVLDEVEWCQVTGDYVPKPTPLCYYCEFSESNPNAQWFTQGLCDYNSLWTPENRTFAKNKEYN